LFELSVIYVLASPPGFWGMVLYKKRWTITAKGKHIARQAIALR